MDWIMSSYQPKQQPTPVFLPEKSHWQGSLVGFSPRGHKELDMTEQPDFPFHQPKFICRSPDSQYLRMWLYLEIGSSNQVKRQALIQND